ncbi:MAG TPA: helical backbone metal receptor [Deltaproteobacteria bacterium]|nr:helical backbone metal receptor [Deltaproteobacteria bacterium]
MREHPARAANPPMMASRGPTAMILALLALALSAWPASAGQDSTPGRIVSLAPSITRELSDLGAQDLLVGATTHCPLPAGTSVRIVGSPGRISIERVYALKPAIVLASTDCNSRADVAALKGLGCAIHVFAGCETLACMCTSFRELGDLLGRSDRADAIVKDVQARIRAIESGVRATHRPKVFWQVGASPLVTASDATFAGEFLRRAGAVNVFGDARMRYPRVNAEEVLRRDPDVIIVVSRMEPGSGSTLWERYPGMSAVRSGRVHELSADLVCQPTPAMFLKALEAVVAAVHPGEP